MNTQLSFIFTLAQSDNFRAGYLQFATWKPCHCHWIGSCYARDHTVPLSAGSYSGMCPCGDAVITGRAYTFVNNEDDLVGRVMCHPYTSPLRGDVTTTLPLSALRLFLLQRGYYLLRFPVSSRLCFLHHHFVPTCSCVTAEIVVLLICRGREITASLVFRTYRPPVTWTHRTRLLRR